MKENIKNIIDKFILFKEYELEYFIDEFCIFDVIYLMIGRRKYE